jgi:hypothetical protein
VDYTGLDVLALLADNSWNGGIVLSELVTNWPDLANVVGTATQDGTAIGEGHGAISSAIPSIRWRGSPRISPRGAKASRPGRS